MRVDIVPELQSPRGPSFNQRPEFHWHDLPSVDSWQIWIQSGRDVINVADIAENRFTPGEDLASREYRWWVRGRHANGWSGWSSPETFNTAGRTEVFPKKESPFDSPVVEISFAGISEAASYELYVRHEETRDVVFHGNIGNSTGRLLPLPVSGNYEVWALAIANDGTRGAWSRRVIYKSNGVPLSNASAVLQPVANSVHATPTLRWDSPNGADSFDAVLWHDETQTERKMQLSGNGVWIPPNLASGEWAWFVRARDAEGFAGEWVHGNKFLLGGKTRLTSPVGPVDDIRPLIRWEAVTGADRYELAVLDADRNQVFRTNAVDGNVASLRPNIDLAAGRHRAWIRIIRNDGTFGPWSEQFDFEIVI